MAEYSERVVCFIDVLGWKHEVEAISEVSGMADEDQLSRLNRALDKIESILTESSGQFPSGFDVTHFSDSLIVSCPIETQGVVFQLLNRMQLLQTVLIEEDVLLRGGITIGKMFHVSSRVFGAGVNEAYKLENEIAIYPRVIISPCVVEAVEKGVGIEHSSKEEMEYIDGLTSMDDDGQRFIDYFKKTECNFDPIDTYKDTYIPKIRAVISNGLNNTDPNVLEKYQWLKDKVDLLG